MHHFGLPPKDHDGDALVCRRPHESSFFILGVSSWTEGCGTSPRPVVYSSILHALDWILEQLHGEFHLKDTVEQFSKYDSPFTLVLHLHRLHSLQLALTGKLNHQAFLADSKGGNVRYSRNEARL